MGPGIAAGNITTGIVATARGGLGADVSGYSTGLYGVLAGTPTNVNTFAKWIQAVGVTGSPDGTKFVRDDGTLQTVASGGSPLTVREIDGSPSVAAVTTMQFPNATLTDNGGGNVTVNVTGGGSGDVSSTVGVSVDGEMPLFNGTTGKQIKRSALTGGLLESVNGVPAIVNTSARLQALIPGTGTNLVVYSNSPTLVSPSLGNASGTQFTSPIFQSNSGSPATSGVFRLGNLENLAWKTSAADATLTVDASRIMQSSVTFQCSCLNGKRKRCSQCNGQPEFLFADKFGATLRKDKRSGRNRAAPLRPISQS